MELPLGVVAVTDGLPLGGVVEEDGGGVVEEDGEIVGASGVDGG